MRRQPNQPSPNAGGTARLKGVGMNRWMEKLLGMVLVLVLSGLLQPAMLLAQQAPTEAPAQTQQPQAQPQNTQPQEQNEAQPQEQNPGRQDVEDKASQELINRNHLPDSPGATKPQPEQEKATPAVAQQPVQNAPQPSGTAAAQAGKLSGNAASRPAGAAIAPAKQRQVRSFLIKMGVIAGAGVAIGTVALLSKGTSPKPPGAR
jgi:outer membrane biosynthesis protein TonB